MTETVFITGATSGFGEACAERFAKEGWKLVLAARRTERLLALQERLGGKSSVCIITLDVRDPDAVKTALGGIPDDFQSIDVLVNNAGLALGMGPAHQASMDDWDTMVDTNIKGVLHCTREILPRMVERNKGHIVNIGSVAGDYAYPGGNVYGSTKAFVKQFSRNLRADLIGTGLRVTNIEPGLAETEFNLVRFKGDKEKAAQLYEGTENLTSEDIAETVYWAVSLPPHVNINRIEVMPVCQSWAMFAIARKSNE